MKALFNEPYSHRNTATKLDQMVEKAQAELKETEVATFGAVHDEVPSLFDGSGAQVDDPMISQASGDHEP